MIITIFFTLTSVVFAMDKTAQITFKGNDTTLLPAFTLYVLHEGRPYRVQAPTGSDPVWPTLTLYQYDSVTLISSKSEDASCSNRVIRILPRGGVDWEIPFKNVVGCESMRWENKESIRVPDDF